MSEIELFGGVQAKKPNSASTHSSQLSKYNFRTQSSMKNLLSEYGLNASEDEIIKPTAVNKFAKKPVQRAFLDNDATKEAAKLKSRKQYYTQIYEDMYKLRDYFRDEYHDRLQDKVKKQRMKTLRNAEYQNRRNEQMNKERTHRQKSERHELIHDSAFLRDIPKSQYYKFAALERKLKAMGKLNTTSELERYWTTIRQSDEAFKQYLKSTQTNRAGEGDVARKLSDSPLRQVALPVKLTQIMESRESTGCSSQRLLTHWQQTSSTLSRKSQDPYSIARLAAADLDQKHPQMHLPSLHCFDVEPVRGVEDEMQQEWDQQRQVEQRALYLKRLRRMYDLAHSNNASTKRILDNHDNLFDRCDGGAQICEMIPAELLWPEDEPEPELSEEMTKPWLRYIKKKTDEKQIEDAAVVVAKPKSLSSLQSLKSSQLEPVIVLRQPLGLNELMEKSKTIEAKCLSTLWHNYVTVG